MVENQHIILQTFAHDYIMLSCGCQSKINKKHYWSFNSIEECESTILLS